MSGMLLKLLVKQLKFKTILRVIEIAKENHIAAIGIIPTRTYAVGEEVISFCEKPSEDQAVDFLSEKNWFLRIPLPYHQRSSVNI
jgi:mannose-1-phosphate guanylyltransferase